MDKDFKKIFDKLWNEVHNNISKADKIHRVMDGYQNHLDQMVEEGLMNEHDARMDFYCKTNELLQSVKNAEERMNDDADDESEDCDDDNDISYDDEEKDSEENEPKEYRFRGNGLRLDLRITADDADRSDD